jgi:hypothetical protein
MYKEKISDLHGGNGVEAKALNFEISAVEARILVLMVKSSNGPYPEGVVKYKVRKEAGGYLNQND